MQNCSQCHHWKKLVNTKESWGICTVKVKDLQIPDPMRRILEPYRDMFGSTDPNGGKDCQCFIQFIQTKSKSTHITGHAGFPCPECE